MFETNSLNYLQIFEGFFLGAVLIHTVYSLFAFFGFKEKGIHFLLVIVASISLFIWIFNKIVFKYYFSNLIWWSSVSYPFFSFAAFAFSLELIRLIYIPKKSNPFSNTILVSVRNFFIAFMIISIFLEKNISINLLAFGCILTPVSIMLAVYLNSKHGLKLKDFIGSALYFISILLFVFSYFNIFNSLFIADWSLQIGFFFLLIFSSSNNYDSVRNLKKENYLVENKLNESLENSDKYLNEKVEERTQEINKINIMLMDRAIELGSINQITEKVNSSLDLNDIFNRACTELIKIFPVENTSIALFNDDKKKLSIVAFRANNKSENNLTGFEINLNENILFKEAIETNQILQFKSVALKSNENQITKHDQSTCLNNLLAIPVISKSQTIGAILLSAIEPTYVFNNAEIDLAKAVSEKIANSIENAMHFSQTEKALNIATNDLEIGREIQASFFPSEIKEIDGLEISTYFKPARQVSGDFYDVFQIDKSNYTAFVIADVCDKGVGAALFMVLFRSLLRAFSSNINDINDLNLYLKNIILNTNNYIAETHNNANMFASIFFGIINTDNYKISYINAGLDAPFIINDNGKIINKLEPTGPVVGMFSDMDFEVKSVELKEGDILFAFTDGTTDAKNSKQELFGEEALTKIIAAKWNSAFSMSFNLNTILKKHIGFQVQYDDITHLAIRRKIFGEENKHFIFRDANDSNLEELRDFVEEVVISCGLNKDLAFSFKLAAEEICTNIIKYGYEGKNEGTVEIEFIRKIDKAVLKIFDNGKYFPPDAVEIPDMHGNVEDMKIGGLGLVLVNGLMDKVDYKKLPDGRNQLILEKYLNTVKIN